MSETYTFRSIFSKPISYAKDEDPIVISKVIIPRIQRPYAQGRLGEAETKIRNSFLKDIFKYLTSKNDAIMDFHFIYGSIKNIEDITNQKEYILELLDGQQRFTTLFLLHWFLLNKEKRQNTEVAESIVHALKSFTYETRATATAFCQSLAQYSCSLEDEKPSVCIRRARWYYHNFDKDSTIAGMLVMLDAMNEEYNKTENNNLLEKTERLQFYVLPLMQYNLSEELYMKMNARGLPLSVFDNFKAEFTGALRKCKILTEEKVDLEGGIQNELISHEESISLKLDAKWIDLFWNKNKSNSDESYMRFFSRFFAYRYMIDSDVAAKEMTSKELPIYSFYTLSESKKNENVYLGFDEYEKVLTNHPEYFTALEKVLDTLCSHKEEIAKSLTPAWGKEKEENFFLDSTATFSQTLLVVFGAICEFILCYEDWEADIYQKWMRIVWNIIENTNIDSLIPATNTLRNLSNFTKAVASNQHKASTFYDLKFRAKCNNSFFEAVAASKEIGSWPRPFQEEIEKAKRIAENPDWLTVFQSVEVNPFIKGTTCFFYEEGMPIEVFCKNCECIQEMFDKEGISPYYRKNHVLLRAINSNLYEWDGQLENRYVTEDSEPKKFLKTFLINEPIIRKMLIAAFKNANNKEEITFFLEEYIKSNIVSLNGLENWDLQLAIAHNILCQDIRLYDWMTSQKAPVCISWFKGHIAVAIPRVWYDRYLIDSERDAIAQKLKDDFSMEYWEDETKHTYLSDFEETGHYKGEDLFMFASLSDKEDYSMNCWFKNYHEIRIFIQCPSQKKCKELEKLLLEGTIYDDERNCLYFDTDMDGNLMASFHYFSISDYSPIKKRLEEIWDKVESAVKKLTNNK